jgi:hypothetical protein
MVPASRVTEPLMGTSTRLSTTVVETPVAGRALAHALVDAVLRRLFGPPLSMIVESVRRPHRQRVGGAGCRDRPLRSRPPDRVAQGGIQRVLRPSSNRVGAWSGPGISRSTSRSTVDRGPVLARGHQRFQPGFALPVAAAVCNDEKTPRIMEWLRRIYERPATRQTWSKGRTPMASRVAILERSAPAGQ